MDFLKGTKDFVRNPLGIIALFISLIYGFASLLLDSSAEKLTVAERWPLILFIVFFPIFVLITFYKLVTKHHGKLYAPADFKDDKSFLRTLSPEEQEEKLENEVNESLGTQEDLTLEENINVVKNIKDLEKENREREERKKTYLEFREELKNIESSVIKSIASEFKINAEVNVGIGETEVKFDAFLPNNSEKLTFLEVKAFRSSHTSMMILDRILYQSLIADRFFSSKFKLILAVVYFFDEKELSRFENVWRRKIDKSPVDIELRFLHISQVKNT
ncbi:hypothetical protein [uncultured Psychromonas sp.]|uniref:hypothetical protein n=1 Tax=uncultured Psychromonas sp. TaxID=173974 RepID=UPI00261A4354|nr:hypothetical protein [uncultured Psychromonas sp.]